MHVDLLDFKRSMAEFGITDQNFFQGLYSQLTLALLKSID